MSAHTCGAAECRRCCSLPNCSERNQASCLHTESCACGRWRDPSHKAACVQPMLVNCAHESQTVRISALAVLSTVLCIVRTFLSHAHMPCAFAASANDSTAHVARAGHTAQATVHAHLGDCACPWSLRTAPYQTTSNNLPTNQPACALSHARTCRPLSGVHQADYCWT